MHDLSRGRSFSSCPRDHWGYMAVSETQARVKGQNQRHFIAARCEQARSTSNPFASEISNSRTKTLWVRNDKEKRRGVYRLLEDIYFYSQPLFKYAMKQKQLTAHLCHVSKQMARKISFPGCESCRRLRKCMLG